MTSPFGKDEQCAKFVIEDASNLFVLHDIAVIGQQYTFSCWLQSESAGMVTVGGSDFVTSSVWTKHSVTFRANTDDIAIIFGAAGTYYIYQPQLETGNRATDWTPAPEDLAPAEDLDATNSELAAVKESVAQVKVESNEITSSVREVETRLNESISSVDARVETLTQEVATKMTPEAFEIQIQQAMQNGPSKVVTSTGYTFDDEGLTVQKSGSEMKTQISEDGMTVYQNEEAVLTANGNGVDAKNLHATTYLIVGVNSRFEDFGEGRTGCFWIGG